MKYLFDVIFFISTHSFNKVTKNGLGNRWNKMSALAEVYLNTKSCLISSHTCSDKGKSLRRVDICLFFIYIPTNKVI